MKKALMVSTIIGFLASFERSDISLLQGLGYEVHVACNCDVYGSEERLQMLTDMGVIKHHIPFARNPFSKTNFSAYKRLKEIIKQERFDIVHCHTPVGGVLGRMASHACHVPVIIYTAHGFHFFKGCPPKNRIVFYPVERLMSHYTGILITINNEDYNVASREFHAAKTERIHGVGIEIDKFRVEGKSRQEKRKELGLLENQKLLLSVGELDKDKNHIEIIEAMKELGHEGYVLMIAGSGSLFDSHSQYIKNNGLENCVKLLGYRKDIPELLQATDIYVFPSLFEGLSVALMEAVAAKLPIACSEVRGNVDTVVTSESYFPTDDVSKYVGVIKTIDAMSDEKKQKMVEMNYQNLLKYRLSEVQKEMRAIYKSADEMVEKARTKA